MASWIDVFSLIATLSVCGGTVYGVLYVANMISKNIQAKKEDMKARGLTISRTGVSVKTSKRFDREDYVDATQRGLMKAVNASSFRHGDDGSHSTSPRVQHAE